MPTTMTCKERVLAALSLEEPDRVPIAMRGMEPLAHLWKGNFHRARVLRDRFGIDDFLYTTYKWTYDPAVEETREWKTYGEKNDPLLVTEYRTPAGVLHNEVVMTDDYHVDRLYLQADQLMPRMVVRTLQDGDDVEKFRYLLPDPSACDLPRWDETMRELVAFGREEGFPTGLYVPSPSGIAMKNMGALDLVMRAADDDPMVPQALGALTEWALKWIDYAAQFEPDIIYHSGVYESTDFWSPGLFCRLFAPIHRKIAERAHAHGMKYINYLTTGIDALTEELKGLGIDAIYGWDSTPPGDADMCKLKRILGDEMAFWGGLSPTWVVERGTEQQIRAAVKEHISVLAPGGGYILCTGGSVFFAERAGLGGKKWDGDPEESQTYRNLLTLFEAGLECGRYPLAV